MAGKIVADIIEASGSQISLNVGNVTILTASSTGLTLTPTTNVNINIASGSAAFTTANVTTANITGVAKFSAGSVGTPSITASGDTNTGIFFSAADTIDFAEGGTATGQFDSSGNFKFNSGFGSVATAYGCRAFVQFDGTGVVAMRASGNVSSITDNGVGDYTVNFTTAMPDANYAISGAAMYPSSTNSHFVSYGDSNGASGTLPTTSAFRFRTMYAVSATNAQDCTIVTIMVIR